jgi:hypothetical protein
MAWVEFLNYLLRKAAGWRVNVMLSNLVVAGGGDGIGCGEAGPYVAWDSLTVIRLPSLVALLSVTFPRYQGCPAPIIHIWVARSSGIPTLM